MNLFSRTNGEGENALIILPGLLGSSANWQSIAKRMGQRRSVYTLDMRNHGQSPWSDSMNYDTMADDVAEFIESLDHTRICLLGHSMGGKAAMRLALKAPRHIDTLIAADIAPVAYEHDFDDLIKPMLELDLPAFSNRADADVALKLSVPDPHIRAFLLHNLSYDKNSGAYVWRPNLEVLLKSMPVITDFRLTDTELFEKPALFIHGANSDYVTISNKAVITQHFTQTTFVELENAGHWLHAEQPAAFIKSCESFLSHDY
ncbi:MAG: alpha/beta fold hydrolase [Proteobacteria bacterium]|nr:alpha/beta fold hydrolase [Pseudomonadota bacterium]